VQDEPLGLPNNPLLILLLGNWKQFSRATYLLVLSVLFASYASWSRWRWRAREANSKIVNKGLFWRCYDEFITCPRCSRKHKRGHIGSEDICGKPYLNQEAQNDTTT
jgi:hypothetical protein